MVWGYLNIVDNILSYCDSKGESHTSQLPQISKRPRSMKLILDEIRKADESEESSSEDENNVKDVEKLLDNENFKRIWRESMTRGTTKILKSFSQILHKQYDIPEDIANEFLKWLAHRINYKINVLHIDQIPTKEKSLQTKYNITYENHCSELPDMVQSSRTLFYLPNKTVAQLFQSLGFNIIEMHWNKRKANSHYNYISGYRANYYKYGEAPKFKRINLTTNINNWFGSVPEEQAKHFYLLADDPIVSDDSDDEYY